MTFRAVDVLGFAGGFTLGMVQAGFELVGKRELPGGFGVANCEANRHLLGHTWESQAVDPTQWEPVAADVVFGNPPCSGFSGLSAKHFRGAHSPINHCMWSFVDYVARVRPTIAVFESVQLAFTRPDGLELMRALREHLEAKTNDEWTLYHVLHDAYAVGGCARRRRYFWVVTRVPFGIEWPQHERLPVLRDAIGDLDGLPEAWHRQPNPTPRSWWSASRSTDDLSVDGHTTVRNPLTHRVGQLMQGIRWLPREHLAQVARRYYETHGRLPDAWVASQDKLVKTNFAMGFSTPVRWDYDAPGRVITGSGLLTAIHPTKPRPLSHREVARVMGFPDTWLIEPLKNVSGLSATWGKGITVDCGRWIGGWIKVALEESPGSYTGVQIGDREFLVDVSDAWLSTVVQSDPTRKFRKLLGGTTMTEPVPAVEPTEGAEPAATEKKGRPRPTATVELDQRGLQHIQNTPDGVTKETLGEALGVAPNLAYLVIYRLRVAGEIHKEHVGGKYVWKAGAPTVSEAQPEATLETPAEPVAI